MFERVIKLIGEDNLKKIQSQKVMVIGLGGVGGYAVESLIRSGLENIVIVGYDIIDISNLNRQIITNRNNIGTLKVEETTKRILSINPNAVVEQVKIKLDENNINILFDYNPDYIIDCCDTLVVKQELIKECLKKKIKFISSMGTGNKIKPSLLEVIDISKTSYDPIAKKIRKYLRDNNIRGKVPVICSKEQGNKFKGDIPSMIFVPATAGLLGANYVINDILNSK